MEKIATPLPQQKIKEAFLQLAAADSTQMRDSLFSQLAAENPQLAKEVGSLLRASEAGNVIEQICGLVPHPLLADTNVSDPDFPAPGAGRPLGGIGEGPGTLLGPYKLLEQIGEGGMGTVFHAQQSKPIRRRVALKIIKPGMDTGQVIARFEAERQALALMDHPNIAKVLDAGTTEQGRPYFVMELVKGIPITDYCTREKLDIDGLLKLFIDVCHGVQHAHQKGIIHRDLKPSNILITLHDGKPVVKIIDFGIAKAIDQELTERTLFTQMSQLIGTPLYMSPEQAEVSGLDIDTRSDVYSLGVVLYELLTGTTPFDRESMKKVGIDEIRRMIRETEPPRPSQRFSTLKAGVDETSSRSQSRDLKRSQLKLQGELDWIVMKALEKNRNRRYETVNDMARDIQRYLENEPIEARPPSLTYRLGKLARRNKVAFGFGSVIVTSLFVGVVGLSVANNILSDSRQDTQNALQKASQNFELAQTRAADALASQQTAEAALREAEAERKRAEDNFRKSIVTVDRLLSHVGSESLMDVPQAAPVRTAILQEALDLFEGFLLERSDDPTVRHGVAMAYLRIGDVEVGIDQDAVEHCYRSALDLLTELSAEVRDNLEVRLDLADTYSRFAWHVHADREDQLKQAGRSIELLEGLLREPLISRQIAANAAFPPEPLNRSATFQLSTGPVNARVVCGKLVGMYTLYGHELTTQGQFGDARVYFDKANDLAVHGGADPDIRAEVHLGLANWHARQEDIPAALSEMDRAIELFQKHLDAHPQSFWYQELLARHLLSRGNLRLRSGQTKAGLLDHQRAFERFHELHSARRLNYTRMMLSTSHAALVKALQATQPVEQRIAVLHDILERFPDLTDFQDLLGTLVAAGTNKQQSLQQMSALIGEFHKAAELRYWRARLYQDMGDPHQALSDLYAALALAPDNSKVRSALVTELFSQREDAAALPHVEVLIEGALERASDDGPPVEWLPIQALAHPLDEARAARVLELVNRIVQRAGNSVGALIQRYAILLEFGERARASADLDAILDSEELTVVLLSQAAFVSLHFDAMEQYRLLCLRMLETFSTSGTTEENHLIAWTCALGPEAIEDYAPAIQLARRSVEKEPANPQYLIGLGAILMRSGQYAEARIELEKAIAANDTEDTSPCCAHYLLAMTQFHLGNSDAAQSHLKTAHTLADTELAGSGSWIRKTTIELLRNDAQTLIREQ